MDKKVLDQKKLEEKLVKAREKASSATEIRAVRAFYDVESGKVRVLLSNGVEFSFPSELGQGLVGASPEDLAEVELTPSGEGLHWAKLDVDFSIPALINGIFGTKQWMAEIGRKGGSSTTLAKSEASRQNGLKGGRPRKSAEKTENFSITS